MPAEPRALALTPAEFAELGSRTRETFVESLPQLTESYLDLVRTSGDAETYRKALELGFKTHGAIIEERKGSANLPSINVTIDMSAGRMHIAATSQDITPQQDIVELEEMFDQLVAQRKQTKSEEATEFLNFLPVQVVE